MKNLLKIPETTKNQRVQLNEGLPFKKQELPDARAHQLVSFLKSTVRIGACIAGIWGFYELGFVGLLLAEIVGIYEELV